MDETKKVDREFIADLVEKTSFNEELLTKDYYLTRILYLLKDTSGMYFKGGTALQKAFLNHARLSEDLDFTLTEDISKKEKEIRQLLENQDFVTNITRDKSVPQFIRMIVHYVSFRGENNTIFLDLNERGKLFTKSELYKISHFYPDIPPFSFPCLSMEEMVAEKVAAAICRNKPRDHYDIYQIIKNKIPINMKIVEQKCKLSDHEFSIIKMFNNAKKLKKRWDEDLMPLLIEQVTFQEVMQTLAKHFNLKYEKLKKNN
jgi:predicted nucleotidyltransferase component of viral defense system